MNTLYLQELLKIVKNQLSGNSKKLSYLISLSKRMGQHKKVIQNIIHNK